jgi:hypothetical protein
VLAWIGFRNADTGRRYLNRAVHNWATLHVDSVRDWLVAHRTPGIGMTRQNFRPAFRALSDYRSRLKECFNRLFLSHSSESSNLSLRSRWQNAAPAALFHELFRRWALYHRHRLRFNFYSRTFGVLLLLLVIADTNGRLANPAVTLCSFDRHLCLRETVRAPSKNF